MNEKPLPPGNTLLTRRRFSSAIASVALIPLSVVVACLPRIAAAASVDESTPQAKALKYTSQSATPNQKCGNCTLYQGKPGQASGACPLFSGLKVNEAAWCSAWIPRA